MARIIFLAICLTVAPSVIGWRHTSHLTESRKGNSTASGQVSSLGYPCNLEEFRRAGFASEWDKRCGKYHKLVFLHVPKTAGESVEAALRMKKNHIGARLRREKMGEVAWGCAFKFSIARNPWARWESWYSFCKSGYHIHRRGVLPEPHWGCQMARSMTLSSWTKNMILILGGLGILSPDLRTNMTRTGGDFYWAWYFESQSEYVTDGVHLDVLLPNFIISFENLESDFKCMTTLLGLSVNLRHKNPSVLVKGESTAERVSEFDQEARELIREYYRFEIEQYGYEFPV